MSHTTIYNAEADTIETTVWGNLSFDEAKILISDILQLAQENGCFRVLTDYRETKLGFSIIDLYSIPRIISEAATALGIHANKFKRALVVPNSSKDFAFFETVSLNNGQTVKLFYDIEKAKHWLMGK